MIKSQLVIQTAFLGDLILSIPLFKRLRQTHPNDQIILVCKAGLGEYFLKEKIVDQVFEIKKNDRHSYKNAIEQLNKANIENLFCIHRSIRSQLTSLQIKAKNKVGFKSVIGFFIFNKMVNFCASWPEALRQLNILTATDSQIKDMLSASDWSVLNTVDKNGVLPKIPKQFEFSFAEQKKQKVNSKKIALFPGSVWATKKWTESGFATVANSFIDLGYEVYLMGGPDEKQLCLSVQALSPKSIVLAGTMTIAQSIEYINTCELVVANDSAPTHMSACQNIPVVSIFGPTVPSQGFRPWSDASIIIQQDNLNCRPCGKHGHKQCPLGHHKCMKDIQPEQVVQAGIQLMKNL